jgi:hypothetical protein
MNLITANPGAAWPHVPMAGNPRTIFQIQALAVHLAFHSNTMAKDSSLLNVSQLSPPNAASF